MRVSATLALVVLPVLSPACATIVLAPTLSGTTVLNAPPAPRVTAVPFTVNELTPPLSVAVPVTVALALLILLPLAGAGILTTGAAGESASAAARALTPPPIPPAPTFPGWENGGLGGMGPASADWGQP